MKKFLLGSALALCFMIPTMAQTPTPTITAPCIFTAPTIGTAPSAISLTFESLRDYLLLPSIEASATPTVLNCTNTTPEQVGALGVSESVGINELLPSSTNVPNALEGVPGYAIVNTPFANMRSGDSQEYTKVGIVEGGDVLLILGRNSSATWWYVQSGELRGWVLGTLLFLRGDLTDVPVVETLGEFVPVTLAVPYTGNLLYNGLQSSSVVICQLQGDINFLVKGISFNDSWFYIEGICLDGTIQEGWIAADRGFLRNPAGLRIPTLRG
jgi:hypothetical protein